MSPANFKGMLQWWIKQSQIPCQALQGTSESLKWTQLTISLVSNFPWKVKGDLEMMSYECLQNSTLSENPGIQIRDQCHIWVLPQTSVTEQHQKIHPKTWWTWQHEFSLASLKEATFSLFVLMANTRNRDTVSAEPTLHNTLILRNGTSTSHYPV